MTKTAPTDASARAATDRLSHIARAAMSDRAEATRLAIQAKQDGVGGVLVHHLVAQSMKGEDRFEDAIAEYGLALELAPNEAGLMTEVGLCLVELDRNREAARVFEAAIRTEPRWAAGHYGYGWAAERLGALDQAKSAWERTITLDPRHADALTGLAGLAARRRDWANARKFADRALAVDPGRTDALTQLVITELGEGDFDSAGVRLRGVIADPNLKPIPRAHARLLLGDVLDADGRYNDAFSAYAEGNTSLAELYAPVFAKPGEPSATVITRAMAEEFERTPRAAWAPPKRTSRHANERGHAFLIGFPRSGTTLLEQVIATHPEMAALGERPLIANAGAEFLSGAGGIERLAATVGELLEPYRDDYWKRVRQFGIRTERKMFVDKQPLGGLRLPLIAKVFPDARIVFVVRDPRDVILSCFRRGFNMNANNYEFTSLNRAADFYDAVMTATTTYLDRLPLAVHQTRHEDLVANFEGETRRMCDFLGVPWTEKLNDFAATDRMIATPSSTQVTRGLYPESVGQWRNYARALEPMIPVLAPWIERFGYPRE